MNGAYGPEAGVRREVLAVSGDAVEVTMVVKRPSMMAAETRLEVTRCLTDR